MTPSMQQIEEKVDRILAELASFKTPNLGGMVTSGDNTSERWKEFAPEYMHSMSISEMLEEIQTRVLPKSEAQRVAKEEAHALAMSEMQALIATFDARLTEGEARMRRLLARLGIEEEG